METMRGAVRQPVPDLDHAERDACLHTLGALHAAGELSLTELEERIAAALEASTKDELAALVRTRARMEVAPRPPTPEEPPAAPARASLADGWVYRLKVVAFLALAVFLAVARGLALTLVAVTIIAVRALLLVLLGVRRATEALVRWARERRATDGRGETEVVPARPQLKAPPSRELVLVPQARVPAQRQPHKVHPVLVPSEVDASSTDVVPVTRAAGVIPAQRAPIAREVIAWDVSSTGTALRRDERRVRELVAQLRPLVHRVTDRATWRRMTTSACERAARTKGWRRTTRAWPSS